MLQAPSTRFLIGCSRCILQPNARSRLHREPDAAGIVGFWPLAERYVTVNDQALVPDDRAADGRAAYGPSACGWRKPDIKAWGDRLVEPASHILRNVRIGEPRNRVHLLVSPPLAGHPAR